MATNKTVSFTTCNLFNLNLPGQKMYGKSGWETFEYNNKVEWMADRLKVLNSDVWGFQELWDRKALEKVFAKARLKSKYKLLIPPSTNGSKIVCAGAARKEILVKEPQWITNFPDDFLLQSKGDDPQTPKIEINLRSFSRPILRFEVKPHSSSSEIAIYVAHLKSRLPTKIYKEPWYDKTKHGNHSNGLGAAISTIRRTAEASALYSLFLEIAN